MPSPDRRVRAILSILVLVAVLAPQSLRAEARACDAAARQAARETGVPEDVLLALTRTETGRSRGGVTAPWPWTVNMEGEGHWFDRRDDALAFVFGRYKAGARSFDIGCFQINYRWHGSAFGSIEDMFDPLQNARYAAGYLKQMRQETGDWARAAGAYHSRTPRHAKRYRKSFERHLARLDVPPAAATAPVAQPKREPAGNGFLLLQGGSGAARGSLVPIDRRLDPLFGGRGGGA